MISKRIWRQNHIIKVSMKPLSKKKFCPNYKILTQISMRKIFKKKFLWIEI